MAKSGVSVRYATSLLETAKEQNILDVVAEDITLILDAILNNRELKSVVESPVIKGEKKASILEEIFKDRINNRTMQFVKFVIEKNREDLLTDICSSFLELKDQHLGIVNVNVKTAFEFSGEQKKMLQDKLEKELNKKVRLGFEIDPHVIGGFTARVKDTVYDASVRHQLELLKRQFLEGGASLN